MGASFPKSAAFQRAESSLRFIGRIGRLTPGHLATGMDGVTSRRIACRRRTARKRRLIVAATTGRFASVTRDGAVRVAVGQELHRPPPTETPIRRPRPAEAWPTPTGRGRRLNRYSYASAATSGGPRSGFGRRPSAICSASVASSARSQSRAFRLIAAHCGGDKESSRAVPRAGQGGPGSALRSRGRRRAGSR